MTKFGQTSLILNLKYQNKNRGMKKKSTKQILPSFIFFRLFLLLVTNKNYKLQLPTPVFQ